MVQGYVNSFTRHNLLDGFFDTDTTAYSPTTGDLIVGSSGSWHGLAIGTSGQVLTAVGGTATWSSAYASPSTATYLLTSASAALPNSTVVSAYPFVNADIATGANIAVAKLANGTTATILQSGASSPAWSAFTLPTSVASGDLWYGSGTNAVSTLTKGTFGQALMMNVSRLPVWQNLTFQRVFVVGNM